MSVPNGSQPFKYFDCDPSGPRRPYTAIEEPRMSRDETRPPRESPHFGCVADSGLQVQEGPEKLE